MNTIGTTSERWRKSGGLDSPRVFLHGIGVKNDQDHRSSAQTAQYRATRGRQSPIARLSPPTGPRSQQKPQSSSPLSLPTQPPLGRHDRRIRRITVIESDAEQTDVERRSRPPSGQSFRSPTRSSSYQGLSDIELSSPRSSSGGQHDTSTKLSCSQTSAKSKSRRARDLQTPCTWKDKETICNARIRDSLDPGWKLQSFPDIARGLSTPRTASSAKGLFYRTLRLVAEDMGFQHDEDQRPKDLYRDMLNQRGCDAIRSALRARVERERLRPARSRFECTQTVDLTAPTDHGTDPSDARNHGVLVAARAEDNTRGQTTLRQHGFALAQGEANGETSWTSDCRDKRSAAPGPLPPLSRRPVLVPRARKSRIEVVDLTSPVRTTMANASKIEEKDEDADFAAEAVPMLCVPDSQEPEEDQSFDDATMLDEDLLDCESRSCISDRHLGPHVRPGYFRSSPPATSASRSPRPSTSSSDGGPLRQDLASSISKTRPLPLTPDLTPSLHRPFQQTNSSHQAWTSGASTGRSGHNLTFRETTHQADSRTAVGSMSIGRLTPYRFAPSSLSGSLKRKYEHLREGQTPCPPHLQPSKLVKMQSKSPGWIRPKLDPVDEETTGVEHSKILPPMSPSRVGNTNRFQPQVIYQCASCGCTQRLGPGRLTTATDVKSEGDMLAYDTEWLKRPSSDTSVSLQRFKSQAVAFCEAIQTFLRDRFPAE